MSAAGRVSATVRFRRGRFQAVEEAAALLGGVSREDAVHLLIGEGLLALYERLGISRDPAVTCAELLRTLAATWAGDLSDEEQAAMKIALQALDRIAQVRARET